MNPVMTRVPGILSQKDRENDWPGLLGILDNFQKTTSPCEPMNKSCFCQVKSSKDFFLKDRMSVAV